MLMYQKVDLGVQDCVGCGACQNICPHGAISMAADAEGFLYPKIQAESCVSCGVCVAHCPIYTEENRNFCMRTPIAVYAGWSLDSETRMSGSSGGIFGELAKYILERGGYVAGAAFTEEHGVEHRIIHDIANLSGLKKSKYLQSAIGNTLSDIQSLLDTQRKILFVGTPCQCAGLRSFLGGQPENLILCDFICHGVNSPLVHQQYISEVEQKISRKVTEIDHRDKSIGWDEYQFAVHCGRQKTLLGGKRVNPYIRGFLTNLYLRPSCYNCRFKGIGHAVDLTLGDCWGYPGDEPMGVSVILVHSESGLFLLEELQPFICLKDYALENILQKNPSIYRSSEDRFKKRGTFFSQLSQYRSLNNVIGYLLGQADQRL